LRVDAIYVDSAEIAEDECEDGADLELCDELPSEESG